MKLSGNFGRWTPTKATVAAAGVLAIAGAVGSAVAFSPIIAPPIKWQGGVGFISNASSGYNKVYTVPAGRNFLLTDLVATNTTGTVSSFAVYTAPGGNCLSTPLVPRLNFTIVPPLNNTVLALQTGIGFAAGQAVCVRHSPRCRSPAAASSTRRTNPAATD